MTGARLLLVDDDPAVLRGLSGLLRDEGYRTVCVGSAAEAEAALTGDDPPGLMLLDLRMPGEGGLALLARLPRPLPAPVVVLSGEATAADAVAALRLGATDFLEKPPSPERLLTTIANALALTALADEGERLRRALAEPGHLVGDSAAMQELRRLVARIGPTEAVVLVTGETGTGKERVARALHLASGRKGRFVAVNCAAIPATLLESELFGHERGAFTGATARHLGRFEQAAGGTLLLDELGDMPLELQAKLLRVLEQREIERVGGSAPIRVDVRVIAATHRDLGRAVSEGRFREDLYYRLAVVPLEVPPLRQRPEDLVPLVRAFAADLLGPALPVELTPEAAATLRSHPFPGNVRELRNFIERVALLREPGGALLIDGAAASLLGPSSRGRPPAPGLQAPLGLGAHSYRALVEEYERCLLRAALERSGGNVAEAARLLRADRAYVHRRVKALGVKEGE